MDDSNPELERLLLDFPPPVADLTRRLRGEILALMPTARERVYRGWKGVGFHHPTAGFVCALFPGEEEVRVGFEHGHLLHDPQGRLSGDGRQVWYLTVAEWSDDLRPLLADLLDQAVQLL